MRQRRVNGWMFRPAVVKDPHVNQAIPMNNVQFLEVKLKNAEQRVVLLWLIC